MAARYTGAVIPLLLLSSCWRPDPELTPDLPPLEPAGRPEEDAPGDGEPDVGDRADEADGPDGAEPDGGEPDGADPDEAEPEGMGPPFVAYAAYTAGAPATIVDDFGKTLCIVSAVGTPVEVRGEEQDIRKRIWCGSCVPAVEGWVQATMVTAPGSLPPARPSEPLPGVVLEGPPIGPSGGVELGPSGR